MTTLDYDLVVIGAGSGGVRAARLAASKGWKVAIVEARFAGGTCVNVGCVPKKLMSHAAHFPHLFTLARDFGWSLPGAPLFDWATLKAQRDAEISNLQGIYRRLLENAGVAFIDGHAQLAGPQAVAVNGKQLSAKRILVATGSKPRVPSIPGHEHLAISDALFSLTEQPETAVIWGGGYIATEFASILNGLGTAVTLVHRGPYILNHFDDEAARLLQTALEQQGIVFRLGQTVREAHPGSVTLDSGETLPCDITFCATGRVPNTTGLALEAAGIVCDAQGHIPVDDHFQTICPSVYALGDVIAGPQLTPVALRQAMNLIAYWFDGATAPRFRLDLVPNAVFSHPCYASVGLPEHKARQQTGSLQIFRSRFTALDHTLGDHTDKVFIKLLVDGQSNALLGAHMVGEGAAEIIQSIAIAMACGATKEQLDQTLGIHPTVAEEWVTLRTSSC